MHKAQKQVLEFSRAFNKPTPDKLTALSKEDRVLCLKLIFEEARELDLASVEENQVEMIDGLCDLLYVTYLMAVKMGIDLEPHFDEVQRANMAKKGGGESEQGKILKPEGWTPPDHERILRTKYKRNAAGCLRCGDVIESKHVHDYVKCRCGILAVDGGPEYLRRSYAEDEYVELSELLDGSYVRPGFDVAFGTPIGIQPSIELSHEEYHADPARVLRLSSFHETVGVKNEEGVVTMRIVSQKALDLDE